MFISFLPFFCIVDITYAKNNITNTFAVSAGWNENKSFPITNQLLAPLIGLVNNTAITDIIAIPYNIGDNFTRTL